MAVSQVVTASLCWVVGSVLACAALTHMTSSLVLGALIGCAACANNPRCRTSALRGTEAIFGLIITVWAASLYWSEAAPETFVAHMLYRFVSVYMGLDAAWMLLSFNGIRLGWNGLGRHCVTWCALLLLNAGAAATGAPLAVVRCAFLYLTTEILTVFAQDYARSPSRQTATPWLACVALYRLPMWHYIGYIAHTAGCAYLLPVAFALIALDCSACYSMSQWLDDKHTAVSAHLPPNMWVSFCDLFRTAALYASYKSAGPDTRSRLNAMYSLSTEQYDATRKLTLFGRDTLIDVIALQAEKCLAAITATGTAPRTLGVWLDIGGGTAENLLLVSKRLDLSLFSHIFVVDYSDAMCAHARARVKEHGWTNVTVVQADAATFKPPAELGRVGFVTLSYSLSMIPGYCALVDAIAAYSDARTRIVVADFFTSKKNDTPLRQHSWWRRWCMQAWFAIDDVDLSPHRREVCEQRLSLAWESNHMGPLLNQSIAKLGPQVPYYIALYTIKSGDAPSDAAADVATFETATTYVSPHHGACDWLLVPSFLYSYAIEDPLIDSKHLKLNEKDSLLLLTTGGDNVLLHLPNVAHVTAVDMNEKQNYLLELKYAAIALSGLPLAEVQAWLEKGSHADIDRLLGRVLPHLSPAARQYWSTHKYMMVEEKSDCEGAHNGLYLYGSYGLVIAVTHLVCSLLGMTQHLDSGDDSAKARTAIAQSWKYSWLKKLITPCMCPQILWPAMGIPSKQHERIEHGQTMKEFINNTVDGTFVHSAWEENYFSYVFARGFFSSSCHPGYLDRSHLEAIRSIPRSELPQRLTIATAPYEEAMQTRMYSKMVYSDHLDWLSDAEIAVFAKKVKKQLLPGGLASFRSASLVASYAQAFIDAGLQCERVATHQGLGMDRLNSYASFYVIRQTTATAPAAAAAAAAAAAKAQATGSPTSVVQARV